jgi:hypothetical protein
MKIEIHYNQQEYNYTWSVWDGPDGIDHAKGTELTLGGCFEKIVEFRLMNGLTYGLTYCENDTDLKRTIASYLPH